MEGTRGGNPARGHTRTICAVTRNSADWCAARELPRKPAVSVTHVASTCERVTVQEYSAGRDFRASDAPP